MGLKPHLNGGHRVQELQAGPVERWAFRVAVVASVAGLVLWGSGSGTAWLVDLGVGWAAIAVALGLQHRRFRRLRR